MMIFSQMAFAESSSDMINNIVEQYKMLGKNKALVVAMDDDKYAAGWGFKFSNTKRAIAKAMKGCQKSRLNYQVSAECKVYMINNKLQVANSVQENVVKEVVVEEVEAKPSTPTTTTVSSTNIPVETVQVDSSIEAVVEADEQMMVLVD